MRILIAGDSLALPRPHRINSYSPDETELAVTYGETYSSLLHVDLLKDLGDQTFVEIINRSRRSQTIQGIYQEFSDHLFFYEPDFIVVQVGIVDCWFRENLNGKQLIDVTQFEEYLQLIVKLLSLRASTRLIIVGICPTSRKMEKKYTGINNEIVKYNKVLKNSQNNKTVFFIDMCRLINKSNISEYLLPDDHHLSKKGNQVVAENLTIRAKAFFYADKGVHLYNEANKRGALNYFIKSFCYFPEYVDNLYNFLSTSYELRELEQVETILDYLTENKFLIKNELSDLINFIKTNKNYKK
ncbi:SGNH/GDSL hydrolase family protein [Chryseomicrobium palamuruense]|uniref:SGNH/GDSL hydrolase family protein n=1 Tax=Chryseomicrobium palamuruense TaxID=682973 RepID=A0ABV8UVY4_9BACL